MQSLQMTIILEILTPAVVMSYALIRIMCLKYWLVLEGNVALGANVLQGELLGTKLDLGT